jgi:hypothetical protein
MTPPTPIALTDSQMATVTAVANHVPHGLRKRFLELTAAFLRDQQRPLNDRGVSLAASAALRKVIGVSDLGDAA